jgi:hypothetical protein
MTNDERMTNVEARMSRLRYLGFVILSTLVIRHSCFLTGGPRKLGTALRWWGRFARPTLRFALAPVGDRRRVGGYAAGTFGAVGEGAEQAGGIGFAEQT